MKRATQPVFWDLGFNTKLIIGVIFFIATVLFARIAFAQIQFDAATYAGAGCPQSLKTGFVPTTSIAIADNRIKVVFEDFAVDAINQSQSHCRISIPLRVDTHHQISVNMVNAMGYLKQSTNSVAQSKIAMRFSNTPDSQVEMVKNWSGLTDANYSFKNDLVATSLNWSTCGEKIFSVIVDYDFYLKNSTAPGSEIRPDDSGFATIDESDLQVQWRYCQ